MRGHYGWRWRSIILIFIVAGSEPGKFYTSRLSSISDCEFDLCSRLLEERVPDSLACQLAV